MSPFKIPPRGRTLLMKQAHLFKKTLVAQGIPRVPMRRMRSERNLTLCTERQVLAEIHYKLDIALSAAKNKQFERLAYFMGIMSGMQVGAKLGIVVKI